MILARDDTSLRADACIGTDVKPLVCRQMLSLWFVIIILVVGRLLTFPLSFALFGGLIERMQVQHRYLQTHVS